MKLNKEELVKWMKLTKVPRLGPAKITKLFAQIQDINLIYRLNNSELIQTKAFNEQMVEDFTKLKNAEDSNFIKVIDECIANNIEIVPITDSRYPYFLKTIPYPPLTLFLKGDLTLLKKEKVAIVGSRKADEKAKTWAYSIARDLAKKDLVIVSGGAKGIDYSAHKGALSVKGKTICVLGSGFFKMFPEEHAELFAEIEKTGLLISEHLPNFPGSGVALVQRNRITSGISNAVLMVASGERGGSMVQTKMAFEQKIPIFYPKKALNLKPGEGLIQIEKDWKGIAVDSYEQVINGMLKRNKEVESYQQKLGDS